MMPFQMLMFMNIVNVYETKSLMFRAFKSNSKIPITRPDSLKIAGFPGLFSGAFQNYFSKSWNRRLITISNS